MYIYETLILFDHCSASHRGWTQYEEHLCNLTAPLWGLKCSIPPPNTILSCMLATLHSRLQKKMARSEQQTGNDGTAF